ncbi:MAG: hypothetical protein ACO1OB_27805 [Archangium sp.]
MQPPRAIVQRLQREPDSEVTAIAFEDSESTQCVTTTGVGMISSSTLKPGSSSKR